MHKLLSLILLVSFLGLGFFAQTRLAFAQDDEAEVQLPISVDVFKSPTSKFGPETNFQVDSTAGRYYKYALKDDKNQLRYELYAQELADSAYASTLFDAIKSKLADAPFIKLNVQKDIHVTLDDSVQRSCTHLSVNYKGSQQEVEIHVEIYLFSVQSFAFMLVGYSDNNQPSSTKNFDVLEIIMQSMTEIKK